MADFGAHVVADPVGQQLEMSVSYAPYSRQDEQHISWLEKGASRMRRCLSLPSFTSCYILESTPIAQSETGMHISSVLLRASGPLVTREAIKRF